MLSKIYVDVMENGSPCITIKMSQVDSDVPPLADKVLKRFFEKLGHESSFVGVVNDARLPDGQRTLIPLDIPHALEWLHRYFRDTLGDPDNSGRINDCFEELRDLLGLLPVIEFIGSAKKS